MKTKIASFVLALFLLPSLVLGQEVSNLSPENSPLRHNIGIEAGGPSSFYSTVVLLTEAILVVPFYAIADKSMDINLKGEYGLSYYYQVNPWLQVGAKSYVEIMQNNIYTDSEKQNLEKKMTMALVNIMPSVKFTYLNRPMVRLYSGIDVGLGILANGLSPDEQEEATSEKSNSCFFSFNITPIGVSVGKKFYGLFETNIGSDAFLKVGIGCRF